MLPGLFLHALLAGWPTFPPAPPDSPAPPEPIAAFVVAGAGAPLGYSGVELQVSPARWMSAAAGVGMGVSGFQVGGMLRGWIAPPGNEGGTYLGAGLSYGRHTWRELCIVDNHCSARKSGNLLWENTEIGYEFRSPNRRFLMRVFGGVAMVLRGSLRCEAFQEEHCRTAHAGDGTSWLPYLGAAWGAAFQ